jgi:hypothetical protein
MHPVVDPAEARGLIGLDYLAAALAGLADSVSRVIFPGGVLLFLEVSVLDHLRGILSACSGGVALRTLGDPSSEVIDHDRQRSILGTAALAVIYTCLERTEDASGLTLEQAVRSLVNDRPEARHSPAN